MIVCVRLVVVLVSLKILALSAPCSWGQEPPKPIDLYCNKAEVIAHIQAKAKSLKNLSGQFQQTKHTRFFTSPVESRGTFQWQPPQNFRWEVTEPIPFRLIAKGDAVLVHYVDLNRAYVYRHPLGNGLLGEITGTAGNGENMEHSYTLQVASVRTEESKGQLWIQLRMEPKSSQQSRHIKQIEVLIDPGPWLPYKIIICEANDDRTIILLSDLIENSLLPDSLFNVTPPAGVHLMQSPGGK